MAETATEYRYVALRDDGIPVISGTRFKVHYLVEATMAYGWSPEELHFQFPSLTMGQIHSALSYYWDHAEEMDRELKDRVGEFDRGHRAAQSFSLQARLRALKTRSL